MRWACSLQRDSRISAISRRQVRSRLRPERKEKNCDAVEIISSRESPALSQEPLKSSRPPATVLAAAHTMSFVAVETFESLSRQRAPLVFAHRSEVTLQRPDKLRVILSGDGPASEFYYDGKTMMALAPAENTLAVTSAPPTIDAALKTIYDSAAIYFPFTDLIVSDPYGELGPGLKHAYYVGQSTVIGGTTTDIVAYPEMACSCKCGSGGGQTAANDARRVLQ